MLDVFKWVDEAGAVTVLRRRVEAVYSVQEEELPADWEHMSDAVEMARMLYAGIEKLKARSQSDSSFLSSNDPAAFEFGRQYDLFSSPGEDFQRLAGIDSSADAGLFMFILSLWEPADYVMTPPEIVGHIANREWVQAVVNAGLLLAPGLSGKMDNAADFIRRFDAAFNVPGVNWFVKRHDLVARGFSEQAAKEIIAGRATRPRWGAGHGKFYRIDDGVSSKANKSTQEGIELEINAGKFLANELGYEIFYPGPVHSKGVRAHIHRRANYQGTGNPDFFIMHPGVDGHTVAREFDVYSPISNDPENIYDAIKDKVRHPRSKLYRQADRIVINLRRVEGDLDLESLKAILANKDTYFLKEIIILDYKDGSYVLEDVLTVSS